MMEFKEPDVDHLIINKVKAPSTDPNIKWNSLEHKGVTFYPRYEPHGKPLLFKVSKIVFLAIFYQRINTDLLSF